MATISSPGLGSGLDVNSIVGALVDAEIKPAEIRLAQKQVDNQARISAVGSIKSALTSLRASLGGISSLKSFQSRTATSSDNNVLTITAEDTAAAGSHDITVNKLATAHSISSASFTSTTTSIGHGDLEISIGDYDGTFTTTTVTIDPDADSLSDIKKAINEADAGVTASIIYDGSGYKLSLVSNETGLANQIKITVNDDGDGVDDNNAGLSQLTYDKTLTSPQSNLTQNVEAFDSSLTIDGISITSSSNTLSNNIDGLTITLKDIGTSTITVANNTNGAKASINSFVKSYNDTMTLINNLSSYNADTGQSGTLQGDTLSRTLSTQLRRAIYEEVNFITGTYKSITDLGITTNTSGQLVVNDAKLTTALTNNFDEVGRVFARGAYTTDSLLEVKAQGTTVAAGIYKVTLDSGTLGDPGPLTGTIGGNAATAEDGVLLEGSGMFSTLSINVLGGSFGNRGNVIVFDGISKKLDNLIEGFVGKQGSITTQLDVLDEQSSSFETETANQAKRRKALEERYYAQFAQLDQLMSTLQGTSSYLTSTLNSLPGAVYNKNS